MSTEGTPTMGYAPGAVRPASDVLRPSPREWLPGWLHRQRWWRSGTAAAVRRVGAARWHDPDGQVGIDIHLIAASVGAETVIYHVPLTYRGGPMPDAPDHGLIATAEHAELGRRWVYDAVVDPVYLELAARHCLGSDLHVLTGHRGLGGEQSNSSVVLTVQGDDGRSQDLMLKAFRVLQAGANPEVTVSASLTRVGCPAVPGFAGAWEAQWLPDGHGDVVATSHALVLSEFIPDARDAWEAWVAAAVAGTSLATEAQQLGATVAQVHEALATTSSPLSSRAMTVRAMELHAQWGQRWDDAVRCVPELSALTPAARQVYDAAIESTPWPDFQPIHGDLHLGQVLHSPSRGWVVVDFEGEPLRPLADRVQPDQPARDVAGMLRSVGYAAATAIRQGTQAHAATAWRDVGEEAFLHGYCNQLGQEVPTALLTAFLVDKAAYEVAYEAAHRPDWMPIPLAAVKELLGARSESPQISG